MTINEAVNILMGFINDRINQYTIQSILDICNQILTLVKLFGANLGNIGLRLLGIENSITAIRTTSDLTLQSILDQTKNEADFLTDGGLQNIQTILDALPGTAPVVLPTTPPPGYGSITGDDVWLYESHAFVTWDSSQYEFAALGVIESAADHANMISGFTGIVDPMNPDFALCCGSMWELAETYSRNPGTPRVDPVPQIDWTAWNGSDALVTFLASQTPGMTWSNTSPLGTTPNWAYSNLAPSWPCWWRCMVSESDLPGRSGKDRVVVKKAEDYAALNIAVGLAALFATGGGDVTAIITELGTLLADAVDLPAALGSLMTWLSGRSESTNQAQSTALTTIDGEVTALTNSGTNTLQTILTAISGLTAPDNADIATIKSDVEAMQTDVTYIRNHLPSAQNLPPVWPGLANVTLGTPVALDAGTIIDGPMDGVLLDITAMERLIPYMTMDTFKTYRNLGRFAFTTDNGYMEDWRGIPNLHGVLTPLRMRQADKLYISCYTGVTGTATPYLTNAT